MDKQTIVELIRRELPEVLRIDEDFRDWIVELTHHRYADRSETESRFDRLLAQMQLDREESARRWDEQNQKSDEKWEEHNRKADEKWEEQNRKWAEHNRKADIKWAEQNRKWDEHNQKADEKWDEQNRKWDEHNRKWEENQQVIREILHRLETQEQKLETQAQKHHNSIGALGARWGIYSETSFRNGLKAILEKSFGVKVENITEYDAEGYVFRAPATIELDVIIYNGLLILCEIKSSVSQSEMMTFRLKSEFYENRHGRKADRKLVISPMVAEAAYQVAEKYGIEVYSHSLDVRTDPPFSYNT